MDRSLNTVRRVNRRVEWRTDCSCAYGPAHRVCGHTKVVFPVLASPFPPPRSWPLATSTRHVHTSGIPRAVRCGIVALGDAGNEDTLSTVESEISWEKRETLPDKGEDASKAYLEIDRLKCTGTGSISAQIETAGRVYGHGGGWAAGINPNAPTIAHETVRGWQLPARLPSRYGWRWSSSALVYTGLRWSALVCPELAPSTS
ncbi:hypothetical protein V496_07053 [Pseudogymnoascus sp. VKM F-4515 (FW-2607)]|nr:hypothetical protein V496_07053 [Pseudogymnoascus sp. VKM F-4515 (FW-2607)]